MNKQAILDQIKESAFQDEFEKISKELTTAGRKHIKGKNFAIPSEKKYPVQDMAHARNALARVEAFGSPSEKAAVKSKVKSKFPALAERSSVIKKKE